MQQEKQANLLVMFLANTRQ